ncbi:MAG: MFS transporter, partial [Blastocatellia bacterium]|nr:MFS transporter [Blastocatellia bacterium]
MAESSIPIGGSQAFADAAKQYSIWKVIMASAVGTVIEWYDFYIFGSLAVTISPLFYPPGNDTLALIVYLVTFAVGFVVRPFGALFFGRIGDLVGRKYAFLVTLVLMGSATAAVGFLPTFRTIGYAAPVILILLRIIQGLALGGEYGGAAVYIAEHVPDQRRGFYTSFIQITATAGLFVSLLVILGVQNWLSREAFSAWGWRLPFLFSIVLVAISLYIRLRMKESPIFQYIKGAGMTSAQPLLEAFTQWENLKRVIVSLFGATAGQGVVWYTGQFYALFYLQTVLKVAPRTANIIVAVALVFGTPFFTVFGALSDKIGRKKIMMAGCLLAVICYIPIYQAMVSAAGNGVVAVTHTKNPVTGEYRLSSAAYAKDPATGQVIMDLATGKPKLEPASAATNPNVTFLIFLVFVQVIFVCMVYGPC